MQDTFIDTWGALAILNTEDNNYRRASQTWDKLLQSDAKLVTTEFVLLEVANNMATLRRRKVFLTWLDTIYETDSIEIVSVSQALMEKGWQTYRQYTDKEWGLVDCISFVVMKEKNITQAFTADRHFQQMGFATLF